MFSGIILSFEFEFAWWRMMRIFSCTYLLSVYFLWGIVQIFFLFFWLRGLLFCWLLRRLCIFWTQILNRIHVLQISFSLFVAFLFILWRVSSPKDTVFNFNITRFISFLFCGLCYWCGMGNTCNSMADSCQCMTKPTPIL